MARPIIGTTFADDLRREECAGVVEFVAREYGITVEAILHSQGPREARRIALFLSRATSGASFNELGRRFHCTGGTAQVLVAGATKQHPKRILRTWLLAYRKDRLERNTT